MVWGEISAACEKRLAGLPGGGVDGKSHEAAADETGNGDGHDPREEEKAESLPVDGPPGTVAETDTDGGAGDAHGGGDGEGVLGEDENGDGGTHLHGGTTARGVVGELVTHDCNDSLAFSVFKLEWWGWGWICFSRLTLHDVVTVSDETDANHGSSNSKLPVRNIGLGGARLTSRPSSVHTSPDTDGVTNIIGAMGKGGGASSDDLDVGVEMLDLVGVLGGVAVDALHANTLGGTLDADLRGVDVIVGTVEEGDDDLGGDALDDGDEVVGLVDGAGAELVVVQGAHGPAEGAAGLAEVGVVGVAGVAEELLVFLVGVLEGRDALLLVGGGGRRGGLGGLDGVATIGGEVLLLDGLGSGAAGIGVGLGVLLDDGVVGDVGLAALGVSGSGALEQKRALEDHPPAEGVVLLDDLGVDIRDEEEGGDEGEAETGAEGDGGDVPSGLLVEAEPGRALVDDGQGAHGARDEEEGRGGVDGPGQGVLAHVDGELDEHEDDGAEAGGDEGGHGEAGEDGAEAGTLVPAPVDLAGADGGDANTGDGGDEGVGGGDVGGVAGAPHDPRGGAGGGAGEGEELDAGVVAEGGAGDDAVLDGGGGAGADGEGAGQLKDRA